MTVLRQMLKPAHSGGGPLREVWTKVVPKVSDKLAGLVAAVTEVTERTTSLEAIVEGWDEKALYLVLSQTAGPDGFAIVDPTLLTGVIEILTTGSVGTAEVADRPPTAVDAALAAHVVNAWIAGVEEESGAARGLRASGPPVPGAREVKLGYTPGVYREVAVHVDMGEGARLGSVRLLIPEAPVAEILTDRPPKQGAMHSVEVKLEVILCQKSVPLEWIRGLSPGMSLSLPASVLGGAHLRAMDGRRVARGRLGQKNGMKAIRIEDEPTALDDAGGGLDDGILTPGFAQEALPPADLEAGFPTMAAPESEDGFPAMGDGLTGEGDEFPAMGDPLGDVGDGLPEDGGTEGFPAMAPMDMSQFGIDEE